MSNALLKRSSSGFFHEIGSPEYDALLPSHLRQPGSRAAIGLDIHKVGTVCSIPQALCLVSGRYPHNFDNLD